MSRKRPRRSPKTRKPGRRWITLLLLVLVGFFGFSFYLGLRGQGEAPSEAVRASIEVREAIVPFPGSPTLVVLNGCGREGLGRRVSTWLRRRGFDVFEVRNADREDYRRTLVIQRSDRAAAAAAIGRALQEECGVGQPLIQRAEVPEADVLLILGEDFPDSLPIH